MPGPNRLYILFDGTTGRSAVYIEYSKAVKGTQLGCLSISLYRRSVNRTISDGEKLGCWEIETVSFQGR